MKQAKTGKQKPNVLSLYSMHLLERTVVLHAKPHVSLHVFRAIYAMQRKALGMCVGKCHLRHVM